MKKRMFAPAMALLLLAAPAGAATTHVGIDDSSQVFDPAVAKAAVGGAVHWSQSRSSEPHNVKQDKGLFRSGEPTTGEIDFSRSFSAGTFHYYCEIHGSRRGGMDGVVKVPVKTAAGPDGLPFVVQWAAKGTKTGSKFDVQYKVGSGSWQSWKSGVTSRKATFGGSNEPLRLRSGKRYSFRARSKKDATHASEWSPVKSFKL